MKWTCWVDRRTCIVVRKNKAVRLGFVGFAIFEALHRQRPYDGKKLTSDTLADIVYNGTKEPGGRQHIHMSVHNLNKKLQHIGLKVRGVNRKQNSFYEIVVLA